MNEFISGLIAKLEPSHAFVLLLIVALLYFAWRLLTSRQMVVTYNGCTFNGAAPDQGETNRK